jgi:hypothetical protein
MTLKFKRNGKENGKTAYLVQRKVAGMWFPVASITFDGTDWVHCEHTLSFEKGRVTRWATLSEAKKEAFKSIR